MSTRDELIERLRARSELMFAWEAYELGRTVPGALDFDNTAHLLRQAADALQAQGCPKGWSFDMDAAPMPGDGEPMQAVLLMWDNRDGSRHVGEAWWHPSDPDGGAWWWANTSPGDYRSDCIRESISGQILAWIPLPPPPTLGDPG